MLEISVKDRAFVFDLDDTLYSERTYEKSGIVAVWQELQSKQIEFIKKIDLNYLLENPKSWVDIVIDSLPRSVEFSKESILTCYRTHSPEIVLYADAKRFLSKLQDIGANIYLITDGRVATQNLKLEALGISNIFSKVFISEEYGFSKPNLYAFRAVMSCSGAKSFVYFADNPIKDFIAPNCLNWLTVCLLDRGSNVHNQAFEGGASDPRYCLNTFDEVVLNCYK